MACTDMDDHAGRFVDHEQVLVLVEDLQGYILGTCSQGEFRRFLLDMEEIPFPDLVVVADDLPPEGDPS